MDTKTRSGDPRRRGRLILAAVVALFALLIVGDLMRKYLVTARDEQAKDVLGEFVPPFRVGDPAPEFSLPDAAGRPRTLTSLVKGDTLLCFLCGCNRCRQMQTYLGTMLKSLGSRAPAVVSVSSGPSEAEAAWKRDTGVAQTMVYDSKQAGAPVIKQYRGDPCPRIYRLDGDRKVRWIGPSPAQVQTMDDWGRSLAEQLGYQIQGAAGMPQPMSQPRLAALTSRFSLPAAGCCDRQERTLP